MNTVEHDQKVKLNNPLAIQHLNMADNNQAPQASPPAPVPPQPQPPQAPPPQRAPPQPQHHAHPSHAPAQLVIPTLRSEHSLSFGRLDSDYQRLSRVLNIAAQDLLPTAVYNQLIQLTSVDPPLTRATFTRMWRTLILKRVQDVIEKQRLQRPEHFVRLARNIMLPAPLADLLYSIGSFHSRTNGLIYTTSQPSRADPAPNWWTVDSQIVAHWQTMMGRFSSSYIMREFPSPSDWENKPLLLTSISDTADTQLRAVRAYTNEVTMNDAFIRFVNDDLYGQEITYQNCHLRIIDGLDRNTIIYDYTRSYVTNVTF